MPFNAMYAISMLKDSLFAAFVLLFSFVLSEWFADKNQDKHSALQFILICMLMLLFRTNGIYAYIIIFMVCSVVLLYRKQMKRIVILCVPFVLFFRIQGPIYRSLGVENIDNIVESLSIPLQHIARVCVDCEEELSDKEREYIEKLAPIDEIQSTYNCRFADPMKNLLLAKESEKIIEANKTEFFSFYIKLCVEHPLEILKAEIDATLGYWYPDEQYFAVYSGVYPNDYGIQTGCDPSGKLYQCILTICNAYRYIPIIGSLTSMGSMFLLTLICVALMLIYKNTTGLFFALPSLAVWCTVMIATPLHAEFRYMYSIMLTAPITLFLTFNINKTNPPPIGIMEKRERRKIGGVISKINRRWEYGKNRRADPLLQ